MPNLVQFSSRELGEQGCTGGGDVGEGLDLLPHLEYDVPAFCDVIRGLNPKARIFQTSCKTGEGIDEWVGWLVERLK